jgi:hypothetical protein
MKHRNHPQGICGLDRSSLTAAGVTRSIVDLKLVAYWAYQSNAPIVIVCAIDPSRWLVCLPGGSVWGASGTAMGAQEAEEKATWASEVRGYNAPIVKVREAVGA